jgi:ferredoxin
VTALDDLTVPAASADPFSVFRELREHDPVHWSEAHQAWLITRYDDVSAAFQNKAFSNDRVRPVLERKRRAGDDSAASGVLGLMTGWMVVNDPPVHTRLRKLAAGAFKGQRIASMSEQITAIVDAHIDRFLEGSGPQDLISEVAYPLPATVIATLLGAPPQDRDRFREWSDELALVAFGTGGVARADRHERALRGLREMDVYFRALIERRRAAPGNDMLSALMAKEGEDLLSDDELVGMCALDRHRGRGVAALRRAHQDPEPVGGRRYRGARPASRGGPARASGARVGEPRPGEVRRSGRPRPAAQPQPAHRVRQGHPRVHRGSARPDRDAHRGGADRRAPARAGVDRGAGVEGRARFACDGPSRREACMRIGLARDVCEAHGQCSIVDLDLFPLDDDGFSAVEPDQQVAAGEEAAAQRGVDACPVRALKVL